MTLDVDGCGLGVACVSVSSGRPGEAVGESYGRGTLSAPVRRRFTIESACAARSIVGGGDGEAVSWTLRAIAAAAGLSDGRELAR